MAESATGSGTIYDLGYQRYDGRRLGRPYAIRTLVLHGLGAVFGIGRGGRALLIPFGLAALATLPAVIQAGVAAYVDALSELITYTNYFSNIPLIFALFCAAQAPKLVSTDLRHETLVMYFARALHREDYVLARVAALTVAVFLLALTPLLVLFLGRVLASPEPGAALVAEAGDLPRIFALSMVAALLVASVSVAIASFTRRTGIASASIIGFFILTAAVSGILGEVVDGPGARRFVLLDPFGVVLGFARWIFGGGGSAGGSATAIPEWWFGATCAAFIGVALGVLVFRYRRVET